MFWVVALFLSFDLFAANSSWEILERSIVTAHLDESKAYFLIEAFTDFNDAWNKRSSYDGDMNKLVLYMPRHSHCYLLYGPVTNPLEEMKHVRQNYSPRADYFDKNMPWLANNEREGVFAGYVTNIPASSQYIQVAAFRNRQMAEDFVASLEEKPYKCFVYEKKDLTRIILGPFPDAFPFLADVKKHYVSKAFVLNSRNQKTRIPDVPPEVNEIMTVNILDKFRMMEKARINTGRTPPDITGTYYADSLHIGYDESGMSGERRANYQITFFDQKSDGTVKVRYTSDSWWFGFGDEVAEGQGAFISGTDANFTVFMEVEGKDSNAWSKSVGIFSGTRVKDGIKDFAYVFVLKEKNDPYNSLIEVGKVREVYEMDGLLSNGDE
jgi:hypothetical protein